MPCLETVTLPFSSSRTEAFFGLPVSETSFEVSSGITIGFDFCKNVLNTWFQHVLYSFTHVVLYMWWSYFLSPLNPRRIYRPWPAWGSSHCRICFWGISLCQLWRDDRCWWWLCGHPRDRPRPWNASSKWLYGRPSKTNFISDCISKPPATCYFLTLYLMSNSQIERRE